MMSTLGKRHFVSIWTVALFCLTLSIIPSTTQASLTCGSTCYTAADVAQETQDYLNGVSGSKCLFIYGTTIYQPPSGTISNAMHKNQHACGSDVSGIMRQSHINNPNHYLNPYVCAPLCTCQDADGDGASDAACGGSDCNDANPAIHPGATETCNSIDDNCNAQIDEGVSQQTSCGVGACLRTITQLCVSGSFSPTCTPGTPSTETCGNGIDDDCDGTIDNGCGSTSPPPTTEPPATSPPPTTPPTTPPAQPPTTGGNDSCAPSCTTYCGQSNGCGGTCPNSDIYTPGRCGNPACVPSCTGESCGQSDGCGGTCSSEDKEACGLCGNAPCCQPEVCSDAKDNDCDGIADDGCSAVETVFRTTSSIATESFTAGTLVVTRTDLLARLAGLVAFFFAGLTLLVGIFRTRLIRKWGRKRVIRFHATVGTFTLLFLGVHVYAVVFDSSWSQTIGPINVAIPFLDNSSVVVFNASFGTLGMYLLLGTILTGALFIKISHAIGYKKWMMLHRLSFLFYAFIFFHALWIGTDFSNPYVIVFFLHVFAIIILYIAFTTAKGTHKRLKVRATGPIVTIADVLTNHSFVGKKVTVSGTLKSSDTKNPAHKWYTVEEDGKKLFILIDATVEEKQYEAITGRVAKQGNDVYLDVLSLR